MDLSIIIAHYDPGNHLDCLYSFHKTLSTLSNQQRDLDIEIIIGDDSPGDEIKAIVDAGAYAEFSFFILTHATQVGLTHVDKEKHRAKGMTIDEMAPRIRAATPEGAIVSSDAGVFLLPPPVEAFREDMLLLESAGFSVIPMHVYVPSFRDWGFNLGMDHLSPKHARQQIPLIDTDSRG